MIDVAKKEKEKGRRVAVAFRLLPSMKAVHNCIDCVNATVDEEEVGLEGDLGLLVPGF